MSDFFYTFNVIPFLVVIAGVFFFRFLWRFFSFFIQKRNNKRFLFLKILCGNKIDFVLIILFLILGFIDDNRFAQFKKDYDIAWSCDAFQRKIFPYDYNEVVKVEIYSDNSRGGRCMVYRVLSKKTLLWETSNSSEIKLFIKEIGKAKKVPFGTPPPVVHNITLHIIFKRKKGGMGYGRCCWNDNVSTPYGLIRHLGPSKSCSYTKTLLPWIKKRIEAKK